MVNYSYHGLRKTAKGVALSTRRCERPPLRIDQDRITQIDAAPVPYWFPDEPIDKTRDMYYQEQCLFDMVVVARQRGACP